MASKEQTADFFRKYAQHQITLTELATFLKVDLIHEALDQYRSYAKENEFKFKIINKPFFKKLKKKEWIELNCETRIKTAESERFCLHPKGQSQQEEWLHGFYYFPYTNMLSIYLYNDQISNLKVEITTDYDSTISKLFKELRADLTFYFLEKKSR
jgi:hypothetical protein